MKKPAAFFWALLALSGPALAAETPREDLRYNQVQQKASHNSYQRKEDVFTQLEDFNIRAIEFDLHAAKAPAGDWLVYHTSKDRFTHCRLLSDCYGQVARFHQLHPDHQAVTIFFDVEGLGKPGRSKQDFYAQIENTFPPGSVLKPSALMSACPAAKTLQESVTLPGCGWPGLAQIRGKFIFVISGGESDFRKPVYDPAQDYVFLVSGATTEQAMRQDPNLIFFNLPGAHPFAGQAREAGFVSRVYWIDTRAKYEKAMALGANILAGDNLDPQKFPWTNTAQPDGFPFKVIE